MFDLEAYWQNRAIALGSTGNFTSAENGTSSTSYLQVRVVSVASAESNNTGGLAADPAVYTTSDPAPPALQAIVTLNVTSGATLDLLLAALLDNTTGAWDGVNGTFASVTSQVASIGFESPVLSALATAPIVSEGLYGTPPYKPTSHPSGGLWGEFWNAVSAVVTTPAGAILALVGEVWTLTLAVTTFLDHLAIEAAKIDGKLLSMSAAALGAAGKVILSALNALLDYVISLVKAALAPVIDPIEAGVSRYDDSLDAPLKQAWLSENSSGSVGLANASSFASAFVDGAPFEIGLVRWVAGKEIVHHPVDQAVWGKDESFHESGRRKRANQSTHMYRAEERPTLGLGEGRSEVSAMTPRLRAQKSAIRAAGMHRLVVEVTTLVFSDSSLYRPRKVDELVPVAGYLILPPAPADQIPRLGTLEFAGHSSAKRAPVDAVPVFVGDGDFRVTPTASTATAALSMTTDFAFLANDASDLPVPIEDIADSKAGRGLAVWDLLAQYSALRRLKRLGVSDGTIILRTDGDLPDWMSGNKRVTANVNGINIAPKLIELIREAERELPPVRRETVIGWNVAEGPIRQAITKGRRNARRADLELYAAMGPRVIHFVNPESQVK